MRKHLRNVALSAIVIVVLLYGLISALQSADATTIKIAKEVDAFIIQYCEDSASLPTLGVLQSKFPKLNRDSGWFFHTDDKSFLIVQYPMRWWNNDAIGEPRISEFTATVATYVVHYHCKKTK